jgi:hypothetical protein
MTLEAVKSESSFHSGASKALVHPVRSHSGFSFYLICYVCKADHLALDILKLPVGLRVCASKETGRLTLSYMEKAMMGMKKICLFIGENNWT